MFIQFTELFTYTVVYDCILIFFLTIQRSVSNTFSNIVNDYRILIHLASIYLINLLWLSIYLPFIFFWSKYNSATDIVLVLFPQRGFLKTGIAGSKFSVVFKPSNTHLETAFQGHCTILGFQQRMTTSHLTRANVEIDQTK